jgi:hypothetical protein
MTTNCTKTLLIIPNGRKIFKKVTKYNNTITFQGPQNFTKIGIFGLKTNHLATLVNVCVQDFMKLSNILLKKLLT